MTLCPPRLFLLPPLRCAESQRAAPMPGRAVHAAGHRLPRRCPLPRRRPLPRCPQRPPIPPHHGGGQMSPHPPPGWTPGTRNPLDGAGDAQTDPRTDGRTEPQSDTWTPPRTAGPTNAPCGHPDGPSAIPTDARTDIRALDGPQGWGDLCSAPHPQVGPRAQAAPRNKAGGVCNSPCWCILGGLWGGGGRSPRGALMGQEGDVSPPPPPASLPAWDKTTASVQALVAPLYWVTHGQTDSHRPMQADGPTDSSGDGRSAAAAEALRCGHGPEWSRGGIPTAGAEPRRGPRPTGKPAGRGETDGHRGTDRQMGMDRKGMDERTDGWARMDIGMEGQGGWTDRQGLLDRMDRQKGMATKQRTAMGSWGQTAMGAEGDGKGQTDKGMDGDIQEAVGTAKGG